MDKPVRQAIIDRRRASTDVSEWVPAGGRKEVARRASELVEVAGARIDELVCGDTQFIEDFCRALKAGAVERDRTCVNAVLAITKKLGQEKILVLEYVRQLGASSEEEARRAIESYRSVADVDTLTMIERFVTVLEGLLPMHEQHRGMVIRRLGGLAPADNIHAATEYP